MEYSFFIIIIIKDKQQPKSNVQQTKVMTMLVLESSL